VLFRSRRTEIDYFNGVLSDLGARLGVPTPVSTLITTIVHRIERRELQTGPDLLDEVHKLVLETIGAA
jgi:ketopantoate reductase